MKPNTLYIKDHPDNDVTPVNAYSVQTVII